MKSLGGPAITLLMTILSLTAWLANAQSAKVNGTSSSNEISGIPAESRSAIMSANNVTFIMYNYGQFTRANTLWNVADMVWHKLGNLFDFGPIFAAEVVDAHGNSIHVLDDGMWSPNQGGYSPDGSIKWGWLPRAGYARAGQAFLATSNNPASWPTSWNSWPGEEGSGVVRGLDEAYYVMDDFTNAKYLYYPFPEDSSRRGLGVSAEVRVHLFGGGLSDAVLISYKFKNESSKPLPKCYVGFFGDPHIGGANDYSDDLVSVPAALPVTLRGTERAIRFITGIATGKGMGDYRPPI